MGSKTAERIIQSAEHMIRKEGYQCFSFRNIASELGVKSSSVHYHFANKEALAVAVTQAYAKRFIDSLNEVPESESATEKLVHYLALFRAALLKDKLFCLCGMLGAEKAALPPSVLKEVQNFFNANLDWLTRIHSQSDLKIARLQAQRLLASLEGAMMIAQTLEDDSFFDQVAVASIKTFLGER